MSVGLLGRKVGMAQVYDDNGVIVPVTVIEAGPCAVTRIRTLDRDGYDAVQLAFGKKARRSVSRADRGQVAEVGGRRQKVRQAAGVAVAQRAGCEPAELMREFRCDGQPHGLEVGSVVTADSFSDLKFVDVIGVSKGRGTAGVMKRHNFGGQRASHGAKRVHRHGGSIGQSADPSRVLRGTRMPGRYGSVRLTVRNLRLVRVDGDAGMVLVEGAVPGPNGGFLILRRSAKNR